MRRPWSLRSRVSTAATMVLALWVIAVTVVLNLALTNHWQTKANDVLTSRAAIAAETVDVNRHGGAVVREATNDALIDVDTWILASGRLLEGPRSKPSVERSVEAIARTPSRFTDLTDPAPLRLYSLPVMVGSRQIATVVTSVSLRPYEESAQALLLGSVAVGLLMIGGAFLVIRASVASALQPVEAMTAQARDWGETDTDRRFGPEARPRELAALASTLDGWLARLSAILRHEKHFAAELSHELRTPLSRIIVEATLAQESAVDRDELLEVLASVVLNAQEMNEILETIFAATKTEMGALTGCCDPHEVAERLALRHGSAAGAHVVVDADEEPVLAGVDPLVLERGIAPVLENAVRYARHEVRVRVAHTGTQVLIDIADDGDGVPREMREHLFEPGRRGSNANGHEGAGLGLALARRVATAAGGTITLLESPAGATFRIAVPRG